jgi:uncharacterized protein
MPRTLGYNDGQGGELLVAPERGFEMSQLIIRRKFLLGLAGAATAAMGGAIYMRWGEARWLEVARVPVSLAAQAAGRSIMRILHLSDFHSSDVVSLDYIAEAIALGLAQRPDLVLLTGDFITTTLSEASRYAEILARLPMAAPTFACFGNHDGGPWARSARGHPTLEQTHGLLREAKITALLNEVGAVTIKDRSVQLIGVGDFWAGMCEPWTAFARLPARNGSIRLVLNHNPDAKDFFRSYDWDVMLCGHTHGGQLSLPLIGTPFAPVRDKRYVEELHRWENRWLYVTRGVGNLHGLRFNCRPQVSVLEIA